MIWWLAGGIGLYVYWARKPIKVSCLCRQQGFICSYSRGVRESGGDPDAAASFVEVGAE